ncbi:MAG: excinuclease ABC subunit UvrA [Thermodesulfobacteriota bacterium]
MEPKQISIRGARMHNLKNLSVDLPRNSLVVFTGLSGSGKSSLAFDTLYAEGQRRYVESLSTYARQFLGQMEKPEVDSLEGLSPAVSIEQRTTSRNPRSTVGTITEIHDHLRLLFARVGRPHCPECGEAIRPSSVQEMVAGLIALPEGSKVVLLAPLVDAKKGEHLAVLQKLRKDGFVRARIDGTVRGLEEEIVLEKTKRHTIEAMVDRLVIKEGVARRLSDSVATAVRLSEGLLLAQLPESGQEILFSERAACVRCGRSLAEPSTQLFSFNNPKGACPECGGLGVKQFFDPDLVVPDQRLSLSQGAVAPWNTDSPSTYLKELLQGLADRYHFDLDTPFAKLPKRAREVILQGSGDEVIAFDYVRFHRHHTHRKPFEGVLPQLARRYLETTSGAVREELEQYMNEQLCPACHGARLKPEALAVRIGEWNIHSLSSQSIGRLLSLLPSLAFSDQELFIAERIIKEIIDRLTFLNDVGLGYISLDRRAGSLSGGEAQRIRLASQIGSRLAGVLYILDEPSIGLHQRDNQRLINTLTRLRDLGNTVIVVEHDEDTIRAADHVLDMGPGAGIHGGEVVYNGDVAGLLHHEDSITGGYLSGRLAIPVPRKRRKPAGKDGWLTIRGATANNLRGLTVRIPLGVMTCVTGVSGSGKSSLVMETLLSGASALLQGHRPLGGLAIDGLDRIDKVIDIDQSPIGRTPRSNPATYTGVLTPVRELFARLPEARARGYQPGRFSFNLKGGRCEACEGEGVIKIAMHFLPDMYITCETCNGKRYNHDTLEIAYRGKNIAEVLAMQVEEALAFFDKVPQVKSKLATLSEVGLGYISLGQSSVTLSGGEAQRIKLSRELSRRGTGRTLYILDEPTTGLHPADIRHLLHVLDRLVENGNTVVIIEHNLDVIKTADYLVDMGPEGGDAGGEVVAAGTPEEVARESRSHTGRFLAEILGRVKAKKS